jgi:hypothetical protein
VSQSATLRLGQIALERGVDVLEMVFVPTAKNKPARQFFGAIGGTSAEIAAAQQNYAFELSTERACTFGDTVAVPEIAMGEELHTGQMPTLTTALISAEVWAKIARDLFDAQTISEMVLTNRLRDRPDDLGERTPPRTETEAQLAEMW